MSGKKIFITYAHRDIDEKLAQEIFNKLKNEGHQPFLASREVRVNSNNINNIHRELLQSNYFVVLLSERSLVSDLITEEIKIARDIADKGKMNIIPIAINLTKNEVINYDITAYLNSCEYLNWEQSSNVEQLLRQITEKIKLEPGISNKIETDIAEVVENMPSYTTQKQPVPNAPLLAPGGNINFNATYYISRKGEQEFISTINNDGALLRIKAPRQYGKTSLLSRIIYHARQNNHLVIPLSLQQIDVKQISNLENLLIQVSAIATRKLKLKNRIKEFWDDEYLDVKMKCSSYFEDYLLEEVPGPVLLAIDEADRVFEFPEVSNEFFSQLRYWHEERNINPIWNKLKMVVSHSTEAYLAINEMNQSPFNVGVERKLEEFTEDEVALFANKLELKLNGKQLDRLRTLVGGHPYLVHVALHSIASGQYSFDKFMKEAAFDHGPYSDHLRRNFWFLTKDKNLSSTFSQVLHNRSCDNTLLCHKLRAAGLIKSDGNTLYPSFQLYEKFFKDKI